MNSHFNPLLPRSIAGLCLLLVSPCLAMDAASDDADLPRVMDSKLVGHLLVDSPFTRTLDPASTYELTGVAYIDGQPVVTICNKFTKQRYLVSDQPNAQNWKLLEVTPNDDLSLTTVRVVIEGDIVAFRFTESELAPEEARKRGQTPPRAVKTSTSKTASSPTKTRTVSFSEETKQQYHSLTDDAKARYKQILEENKDKATSVTPEQLTSFKSSIIDRLAKGSQVGSFK